MAGRTQINHNLFQQNLLPGQNAKPGAPHFVMNGSIHVPASGRNPRPGDSLVYDTTQNQWKFPTSNAESINVRAIVTYDTSVLQSALSSIPSGANSNQYIEYTDNQVAKIAFMGVFAIVLRSDTEAFSAVSQNRSDHKWAALTRPTTVATMHDFTVVTLLEGGNNDIVPAMIGMGRVI